MQKPYIKQFSLDSVLATAYPALFEYTFYFALKHLFQQESISTVTNQIRKGFY